MWQELMVICAKLHFSKIGSSNNGTTLTSGTQIQFEAKKTINDYPGNLTISYEVKEVFLKQKLLV